YARAGAALRRELTCAPLGWLQRLKAAVHYTVGCLCQDVAEDKELQFSRQTVAAISEITFRQCGTSLNVGKHMKVNFSILCRHAKRSTVTLEDVKLLARRSSSLVRLLS
ncbi:CENPS protein, partial [Nothoprocta pentlandii]|nr:CENPS protein [Nothoprocta pentlandii]